MKKELLTEIRVDLEDIKNKIHGSLFSFDTTENHELTGVLTELLYNVCETLEKVCDMEKELDKQTRPDLPDGTPVMCRMPRGDYWVYQLYKGDGKTSDSEDTDVKNAGWSAIVPIEKFEPTNREWLPGPEDNYATNSYE